MKTKDIPALGR